MGQLIFLCERNITLKANVVLVTNESACCQEEAANSVAVLCSVCWSSFTSELPVTNSNFILCYCMSVYCVPQTQCMFFVTQRPNM